MLRRLILLCWILLLASVVQAQADTATSYPIAYGQNVSGQISSDAIFDHWLLNASAHDRIDVHMTGAGGLQPLIGILDANGNLLAHSDNGQINGFVDLTYEIPSAGQYIIVATRVGNQYGTTVGGYTLEVDLLNPPPTRNPLYQDVTFPCSGFDATAAASIQFAHEDTDNGEYSIRVYGLDGFQPVLRFQSGSLDSCITAPAQALGDVVTLPGQRPVALAQTDLSHTVQFVINSQNASDPNAILLTIGSANGQGGAYLAVIGGFAIEPAADTDNYSVRLAPIPAQANAPLLFYAIALNNRLDPTVTTDTSECDDAGRRGCEDVPSALGVGTIFNNGVSVIGTRFDAGAKISDSLPHNLQVVSFKSTTHGAYAVLLIGSLPISSAATSAATESATQAPATPAVTATAAL